MQKQNKKDNQKQNNDQKISKDNRNKRSLTNSVKFRQQFNRTLKQNIFCKNNQIIANNSTWNIKEKYQELKWSQLLKYIEQSSCRSIDICSSEGDSMLIDITYPKFTHLSSISIYNCKINNIQAIAFLQAHQIKFINIQNNLITNISPLGKINYKNLSTLCLQNNKIRYLDAKISRIKIHVNYQLIQKTFQLNNSQKKILKLKFIHQRDNNLFRSQAIDNINKWAKISHLICGTMLFNNLSYPPFKQLQIKAISIQQFKSQKAIQNKFNF